MGVKNTGSIVNSWGSGYQGEDWIIGDSNYAALAKILSH